MEGLTGGLPAQARAVPVAESPRILALAAASQDRGAGGVVTILVLHVASEVGLSGKGFLVEAEGGNGELLLD